VKNLNVHHELIFKNVIIISFAYTFAPALCICYIPTSVIYLLYVYCLTRFIVLTPLQTGLWPYWIKFPCSVFSLSLSPSTATIHFSGCFLCKSFIVYVLHNTFCAIIKQQRSQCKSQEQWRKANTFIILIFKAVQDFITQSGRFAMEWQTQLNSYWQRMRAFSLSLSWFWLICVVVFMLFNIIIHTRCCKMN